MLQEFEQKVEKIKGHFQEELKSIRTGRANPALVANIAVMAYGTPLPLAQLANIFAPEAKLLVIEPWDKSLLKEIEKAIASSGLNLTTASDGVVVRIKLPDLTAETRQSLLKVVGEKLESARVAIRQARDDAKKDIENKKRAGEITEDDRYNFIEKLDKKTRDFSAELETLSKNKEKEIMTI
ncbi:MAG: ribosome recycling factor [Candidatus Komeilibacteria bacterium RIFCSPLOWO2_02_FULL_48_11]|uniref:Ribosome-recycling factor n=1 Tax=Candidatus Komeilibacteria bacterium RIFCSPLOWO2_02_FULL_48_11 TaxID=1798553 RepID=A0A1G2BQI3_9BACT|nr:MAG: ribosome recycling factor [Candidatus Komeilibacteria bacterium RIFCSPLOWO2_02_FULL_48_11]